METVARPKRLIKINTVKDMTAMGKTKIYQLITEGTFPRPADLGPKSVAWSEAEVEDWIQNKLNERDKILVTV